MNYSDYIKMTQIGVYSITFPTDKLIETLESATLEARNGVEFEVLKNPITGKKVHQLDDDGLFFSLRCEFKRVTKELIASKSYEISLRKEVKGADIEQIATVELFNTVPPSSQIINIFYNTKTQILVMNSNNRRAKTALMQLVLLFGLVGVKSIVISSEKLGINTRFINYLNDNTPLFRSLSFENQATLRRHNVDEKTYRTVKHLDSNTGKNNALEAVADGFFVQSLRMSYLEDELHFTLDEHLQIRSMRFKQYAKTARRLNNQEAGSRSVFIGYIGDQYEALNRIIRSTLLEFTQETKLKTFA